MPMLRIMESMAEPMPKYLSGSVTITDLLFMDWNKPVPNPYMTRAKVTSRKLLLAFLHRRHHQIVEGAGAVGVAALLSVVFLLKGDVSAWLYRVAILTMRS